MRMNVGEDVRGKEHLHIVISQLLWKSLWRFLKNITKNLQMNQLYQSLDYTSGNQSAHYKNTGISLLCTALFTITKFRISLSAYQWKSR